MITYILAALVAYTQAQEEQEPITVIGFKFPGFEFGHLWESLTGEERQMIKEKVFDDVITLNDKNPSDYTDLVYVEDVEKSEQSLV